MSTDIVQYDGDTGSSHRILQLGALQLFVELCLPLMLVTFFAWYAVYWWVDRKEERRKDKQRKQVGSA